MKTQICTMSAVARIASAIVFLLCVLTPCQMATTGRSGGVTIGTGRGGTGPVTTGVNVAGRSGSGVTIGTGRIGLGSGLRGETGTPRNTTFSRTLNPSYSDRTGSGSSRATGLSLTRNRTGSIKLGSSGRHRNASVGIGEGRGTLLRGAETGATTTDRAKVAEADVNHLVPEAPVVEDVMPYGGRETIQIGIIVPHKAFGARDYNKGIANAIYALQRSSPRGGPRLKLLTKYHFSQSDVRIDMMPLTPSPTETELIVAVDAI